MYGKLKTAVSALRNKAVLLKSAAFLALAGLVSGTAFAEATSIDIPAQEINWTELPTKIMSAVSGPIVVAIGIGLAVWIMWVGLKFIRRSIS